ncbi:AbiV family abortive infection protein [Demequina sp. NBRC 110052]|uniref:AbiV family abortive infection protein n=1 Tax=Demequina sp. NBRC 110052 TaxID=1570341 RepID=UPI001F392566|nr:AbiV family abortive infection protein [Demequina sp. NBRC 110052]
MCPDEAREYWMALVENATALIEDAATLAPSSPARAQSLLVLAYEELGKAVWVYDAFETAWQEGAGEPVAVPSLGAGARRHSAKFLSAYSFSDVLPRFPIWVVNDEYPRPPAGDPLCERYPGMVFVPPEILELAAKRANDAKQRGFYVDRSSDGSVLTPGEARVFDLDVHLGHVAAAVVTMLVVDEYGARLMGSSPERYSTLMWRLDRFAHDEHYA